MRTLKPIILTALAAMLVPCWAQASPYSVSLKSGNFPKDITVKNENGLLPNVSGYKRGYTESGWIVDRLGSRGYVALSPTYTRYLTEDGTVMMEPSLNVLTLPTLDIKAGDVVRWDAKSLLAGFEESYRVVAEVEGVRNVLFETQAENTEWTTRVADLSDFAGREAVISFECTSVCKYMLALDGILVGMPEDVKFYVTDENKLFFDNETAPGGNAPMTFELLNAGKTLESGTIEFDVAYKPVAEEAISTPWKTGETRTFSFEAPLTLNKRAAYELLYLNQAEMNEPEILADGSLFCSDFVRNLVVDKATGMWCTNCPTGNLVLESLNERFRSNLIELDTHQNDKLENIDYFTDLKFTALPYMMLNRIRNTAGSNDNLFTSYYYQPVKWGVDVDALSKNGNESATVSVRVRSSEAVDNADGRYKVGYVLTADFYQPENPFFYQINGTTTTSGEQYYYLPNTILAPLLKFPNVTLTHATAFEGMEGSIPATVEPGKNYCFSFTIDRPELLENLSEGNIAVFVLDTQTGEIMNAGKSTLANDFSAVKNIVSEGMASAANLINAYADGSVALNLPEGSDYVFEAYSISGAKMASAAGKAMAGEKIRLSLPAGVYLYRLESAAGNSAKKIIVN